MTRLIDADKLKEHIDKLPALPDGNFAGTHRNLKALINMQPTVDAMSYRHGRWIAHTMSEITGYDPALSGDDPVCSYSCSVCGEDCYVSDTGDDILSNYCPNCGADMREVEHETD